MAISLGNAARIGHHFDHGLFESKFVVIDME